MSPPRPTPRASEVHRFLFAEHPFASCATAATVYAGVILCFGPSLKVSANYFVALPLIVAALSGGRPAGLAVGALGLPANLLLFAIIGHPEFSPASKPIAEAFGIVLGGSLGYLADYYGELVAEIERHKRTEEELREALREKELLLKELHHRVKNNLNVMKSLIQLQRNRSQDPAFIAAADELVNRVLAMALVHDDLYEDGSRLEDPRAYLESIAANLATAFAAEPGSISVEVDLRGLSLPPDSAVSLGLVANEALTNAMKHGLPPVELRLVMEAGEFIFTVRDSGPGPGPVDRDEGLGLRIVRSVATQLGGRAKLGPGPGGEGASLEMRWPCAAPSD
jgi:two-component sensor histidine kinase